VSAVPCPRADHDCRPIRLALRAGGLADSGAHPIVSGAGIEGGEELCERAIPAVSRAVGRGRGDHLPRLLVLAANQRDGRVRASLGEDLVDLVLIRPDVPSTHTGGVDLLLCAFECGQQAAAPRSIQLRLPIAMELESKLNHVGRLYGATKLGVPLACDIHSHSLVMGSVEAPRAR
jgi:hypothetical protein